MRQESRKSEQLAKKEKDRVRYDSAQEQDRTRILAALQWFPLMLICKFFKLEINKPMYR